jgi:micrococcal nuclease
MGAAALAFVGVVLTWSQMDGDTLRANLQVWPNIVAQDERIRLIRINTPEVHAKTQCERDLAAKATAYTSKRLGEAKVIEVRVQRGQARDSFGRILGEVFVDGASLNDELLANGLARKYGISTPWC